MEEAGNAATGAPTPITALGDVTNDKRLVHDASPSRRLPREWGTKGRRDLEYLRRLRDPESPEQKDSSRKDGTGAAAAPSTEAEKQAPIRPHDSHRSRIPQKTTRIDDILQVQRDEEEPDHPLPSSFRPARRRTYDSRQRRRDLQEPGSRRSTSVADAPKTTDMAPQPSVSEPEVVEESVARPAKRDSRQLLKQLARAASATPSPPPKNFTMRRAAALADAAVAPKRGPEPKDSLKRESRRTHLDSGATLGGSRPSQVPRMRSPEEVAQGGKNGPSISSIPETAKFATTTELAPLESTEPPSQTPKVTGSWIETPVAPRLSFGSRASAEAGVHKPKQAEDADQAPAQSVEDKQTEPIHQTTEKIGEHATRSSRTGKESAPRSISGQDKAGDASLDRQAAPVLRDVTDQDVDISSLMNVGDDTLEMVSKESGATSRAESDRLKELVALKEMAQRLHAARSGLRGVKKDMKRVEAKIGSQEAAQDAVKDEVEAASTNAKLTSPTPPPAMAQQELRVSTLLRNEFNAFKATLYQRRSSGRIRLTWFGIAFLILVVWCLSEVTLWYALLQSVIRRMVSLTQNAANTTAILYMRDTWLDTASTFMLRGCRLSPRPCCFER